MQRYRHHISAWVFFYKFVAYFQNAFFKEHLDMAASAKCLTWTDHNKFAKLKTLKQQPFGQNFWTTFSTQTKRHFFYKNS